MRSQGHGEVPYGSGPQSPLPEWTFGKTFGRFVYIIILNPFLSIPSAMHVSRFLSRFRPVLLPWSLLAFFGLSFLASCGPEPQDATDAPRPNLVLIFTDELEFNDLSCYGGTIPTPHIDSLAQAGMQFMQAYTPASMCTPARYSLMTGQYPGRCNYPGFLANNPTTHPYSLAWNTLLQSETPTLAKSLKGAGYHTSMAGKWHLSNLALDAASDIPEEGSLKDPDVMEQVKEMYASAVARVRLDGGFDEVHGLIWENPDVHPLKALRYHNQPWIAKGAVEYLQARADEPEPFFLYVAPTAIHGPNHAASLDADIRYTPDGLDEGVPAYALDRDSLRRGMEQQQGARAHRYVGITEVDHLVGQICDELQRQGKAGNTLIVFMADHNIEPGKATCYDKGTHIPFIAAGYGVQQGLNEQSLVQTPDVFATFLDAAGQEPDSVDGQSLLPVFSGEQTQTRRFRYAEAGYARSISDGQHKLIVFRYPEFKVDSLIEEDPAYAPLHIDQFKQAHSMIAMEHFPAYFEPDQLYDLEQDPYEQTNVVNDPAYQEAYASLRQELEALLATFDHPYPMENTRLFDLPQYDQMVARTRAIGTDYIPWYRRDHGELKWPPVE